MSGTERDEEFIERARSGDRAAFAVLVGRYQHAIHRYLRHLTGDAEMALDLTQETFVHAYRAIPQTKPGLMFRPWLYRIATNLAHDHLRRQRRVTWLPLPSADRRTAYDDADMVGERDLVARTLAQLRPEERAVLLACGLEGLSYQQAGIVLGGRAEAVRKRYQRAKERFRQIYAALDGQP